jgi:Domain of unknown function (DUF4838)
LPATQRYNMKKIKIITAALILLAAAGAKAQTLTIYYTPVKKPVIAWADYYNYFDPETLAGDMAGLLQQATGKKTVTAAYDGKASAGIFLLLDSTAKYSANEAAVVTCNGSSSLRITARYGTGLSYGVYTYLDRLGFKFYLPGAEWTIVPKLSTVYLKPISNEEWKPWFKHRYCAMSGGMPAVKNADDNRQNAVAWFTWYRRNRMGSEYMGIGGHIGELFNMMHQKEIEQDPSLVAPEDGINRKYSVSAKLDPVNSKGVNMFINWAIEQYKVNGSTTPSYMPWQGFQTVDPGDGLGYCHTPECEKKFKSVSDQVFYIANTAAKKIKSVYPGAGVSLYAYTERTDTPSVKLEPNVHVGIVATAFHNIATPAALIKRWAKKTTNLSIYDYINIGVWNKEEPFFNLDRYFKYLNHIKSLKISGFTFEAGPSMFSGGIPQYFILKYLNEPYADVQKEFDAFCRNCFGTAAAPLNKMMQEWYFSDCKLATVYDQTTFHEDELGRFFNYMEQASAAANTPAVQQRLGSLRAYLVYLTKHFEFWNDIKQVGAMQKNPALKKQKAEEMLSYTWKLYNTMIFHNTQLNDVIRGYYPEDAAFMKKWDYNGSTVISDLAKSGSIAAVAGEYQQALKTYLPKAAATYTITDSFLEKAARLTPDSIRLRLIDEDAFAYFRYGLEIYCPAAGNLTVTYNAAKSKRPNDKLPSTGFISVISEDYSYTAENYFQPAKPTGKITFALPKKGRYIITFAQNNSTGIAFTVFPGKNLLYVNKKTIPMNGMMLLDEPDNKYKANKYLALYAPSVDSVYYNLIYPDCANYVQLYNAAGKALVQNNQQSPIHVSAKLAPADRNNFIYMTNGLYRWTPVMKNVPPYYFFLKYPPVK